MLADLYNKPLPASRKGVLYSCFSYPTKISPESIAVFIASHTQPGDLVLDAFAGSGTTGLATHLCSQPSQAVIELAERLNAPVSWGPRTCILYEVGVLGAFIAEVMCSPPDPLEFEREAKSLIQRVEERLKSVYTTVDDEGNQGTIRHVIWSDLVVCPDCGQITSYWDLAVSLSPLKINDHFKCPSCSFQGKLDQADRVFEDYYDILTKQTETRKKRIPCYVYGRTGRRTWSRPATSEDMVQFDDFEKQLPLDAIPVVKIPWGDLYRAGYHRGVTYSHHFYTPRNLLVFATVWDEIQRAPTELQAALKFLALSYNAAHSTLMSRVVVKKASKDFVLTGAQSGVLYIGSLPVEKNILAGLRRKINTMVRAFASITESTSEVKVINASSTQLRLADKSVDYVFTDPPFGGFIPYAEVNFLNEVWLGQTTKREDEIIVSSAQAKDVDEYGRLLNEVFAEIERVLKDDGKATVVFHSGQAEIWRALQEAFSSSGLTVKYSSVLDKLQESFKQTTSRITVKGDPLMLLAKSQAPLNEQQSIDIEKEIENLVDWANQATDPRERTPERIYARLVGKFLTGNVEVPINAKDAYNMIKRISEKRGW